VALGGQQNWGVQEILKGNCCEGRNDELDARKLGQVHPNKAENMKERILTSNGQGEARRFSTWCFSFGHNSIKKNQSEEAICLFKALNVL
jgi:hypothetical protein